MIPLFLVALLAARGLPALLYRRLLGTRQASIAGLRTTRAPAASRPLAALHVRPVEPRRGGAREVARSHGAV